MTPTAATASSAFHSDAAPSQPCILKMPCKLLMQGRKSCCSVQGRCLPYCRSVWDSETRGSSSIGCSRLWTRFARFLMRPSASLTLSYVNFNVASDDVCLREGKVDRTRARTSSAQGAQCWHFAESVLAASLVSRSYRQMQSQKRPQCHPKPRMGKLKSLETCGFVAHCTRGLRRAASATVLSDDCDQPFWDGFLVLLTPRVPAQVDSSSTSVAPRSNVRVIDRWIAARADRERGVCTAAVGVLPATSGRETRALCAVQQLTPTSDVRAPDISCVQLAYDG